MNSIDLLHQVDSPEDKEKDQTESVHRDIKIWGEIVQSTSGILKAMKCSSSFSHINGLMEGHVSTP